jgi:hypothetical protein
LNAYLGAQGQEGHAEQDETEYVDSLDVLIEKMENDNPGQLHPWSCQVLEGEFETENRVGCTNVNAAAQQPRMEYHREPQNE